VRRARLELARALVDGGLDRAGFDAARPRLERLDRAHPEPDAVSLAAPLESLTPPDWEAKLERIVERGLVVEGALPASAAAGPWHVTEPAFPYGPTLAAALAEQGVSFAAGGDGAIELVAVASRTPLSADEIERLRALCRKRPVALVALQSDAFLEALPEAALRISACDPTPLTRRVVARTIAAKLREAAAARA